MNATLAVVRPFHSLQTVHALRNNGISTTIFSSAPRKYYSNLPGDVQYHLIPSPVDVLEKVLRCSFPGNLAKRSALFWDYLVARSMATSDAVIGYAAQSYFISAAAVKQGSRFVLDRACPYVDFQQQLIREEAERNEVSYSVLPEWCREHQYVEYERASAILVPSTYTASSFPAELQHKLVIAPLMGRVRHFADSARERNKVFTLGIVGGQILRKGYLYLFEAWRRLALPNARLLVRCSDQFENFPRISKLLKETPGIEVVGYVNDMKDFYAQCDAFILSSTDDGFGMALLEAAGMGAACIATTHCGASDLFNDHEDALVIKPRSVEAIMEAVEFLYSNEEVRLRLANAGLMTARRVAGEDRYARGVMRAVQGNFAV